MEGSGTEPDMMAPLGAHFGAYSDIWIASGNEVSHPPECGAHGSSASCAFNVCQHCLWAFSLCFGSGYGRTEASLLPVSVNKN